jgi:hypothetical protein
VSRPGRRRVLTACAHRCTIPFGPFAVRKAPALNTRRRPMEDSTGRRSLCVRVAQARGHYSNGVQDTNASVIALVSFATRLSASE